ncbi:metallophosphoesterase family protein [Aeoliella sp.]|uniref:metallophosphoesterase family protein n=1 Tax=Aeoliella sp. TaxID=2795800 RepID=UPI003CCBD89D
MPACVVTDWMKIQSFNNEPIRNIPFLNAGKGPGAFYVDQLPVHVGRLSGLPEGIDAILATADLQGRERLESARGEPPRLLGEVLPELLAAEVLPDLGVAPERTGVVLAGDFYTVPNLDQRGGSGDVRSVWQAFARQFKWVVGVAGNHDTFGSTLAPARRMAANADYLDGDVAIVDGLTIAGVGGIIGNPRKPHRKTDQEMAAHLSEVLSLEPDILLMHDGPNDADKGQRGSPMILHALENHAPALVIRGHAHWTEPLAELAGGTQVLNVDCRVAVLGR